MRFPLTLSIPVARFLARKKLGREKDHALVISLDPMGTLLSRAPASATTADPASKRLSVQECLAAVRECGAPVVSICGSEPLEYPEIGLLAKELLDRGLNLFLTSDGTLIRRNLHIIAPDPRLFWNICVHGTEAVHDRRAGRPGTFREVIAGIKSAKNAGFFVYVTTSIHPESDVQDVAALFALLHEIHVDGYILSPVFSRGAAGGNDSVFRQATQQRIREAALLLDAYNLLIAPPDSDLWSGERAGLAGACEISALLDPAPRGMWRMLRWLLSRNMGERRAGRSPAGVPAAPDLNHGAGLAPVGMAGPAAPDSEDQPEMVSGGRRRG
jgi:hypothetical protein